MRKRLTVLTVGCKANFADSASIVREAVSAGFEVVPNAGPADVVVINTCTVTHRADRDCRALVRRARREHPEAAILLAGCYAQISPDAKEKLPEVDHWVGVGQAARLGPVLRGIAGDGHAGSPRPSDYAAGLLLGHRRTFLKIQDGCDFHCAYCVVPLARGKSRSPAEKEIVETAVAAEGDGARELVLTGIHVGLYGADRGEKEGLARLVSVLLAETARVRIRLSSIEPMEITDALLEGIAGHSRACRHLHIPMQSGSDRTLERMRRPYGARRYADIVGNVAARIPGGQVGADVIAGFPGETDEDFEETVRILAGLPVHYLHVFPYSPRPGTESARWRDDVPASVKKERVSRLLRLDGEKRKGYLQAQVGKELEVLVESAHSDRGEISGTSGNYVEVHFPGENREIGELTRVRAESVRGRGLYGRREGGNA
jgi:threonylcarbamoyladenosine tRNA methylthiotransferase MtaB